MPRLPRNHMDELKKLFPPRAQGLFLPPAADAPQDGGIDSDRALMELAVAEARRSVTEKGKLAPKVGAVVARDGKQLGAAHRGELKLGEHAEYTLLERKCDGLALAGTTVYTTLEPCTKRNPPKKACVERLIDRKVARVVIGMLDPNDSIRGKGVLALRRANIDVAFFSSDLMAQVEELNREFSRSQEELGAQSSANNSEPPPPSLLKIESSDMLGMSGSRKPGGPTKVTVSTIGVRVKNVGTQPVRQIRGNVYSARSNAKYPMYLIRDGLLVQPALMLALPPQRYVSITAPLKPLDVSGSGIHVPGPQMTDIEFLDTIPPFTLTIATEFGEHMESVSIEHCETVIRRFMEREPHDGPIWRTPPDPNR